MKDTLRNKCSVIYFCKCYLSGWALGKLDGLDILLKHVRIRCKNKSTHVHKSSSLAWREGLCRIVVRVPPLSNDGLFGSVLILLSTITLWDSNLDINNLSLFWYNSSSYISQRSFSVDKLYLTAVFCACCKFWIHRMTVNTICNIFLFFCKSCISCHRVNSKFTHVGNLIHVVCTTLVINHSFINRWCLSNKCTSGQKCYDQAVSGFEDISHHYFFF